MLYRAQMIRNNSFAAPISIFFVALMGSSAVGQRAFSEPSRDSLSAHGLATLATQDRSLPPVRRLIIKVKEQHDKTGALAPYSERITAHKTHLTRIEQTFQVKLRKPVFSRLHATLQNRLQRGQDGPLDAMMQEIVNRFPARAKRAGAVSPSVDLLPYYVLESSAGDIDIPAKCAELMKDPAIEWAQPDYIVSIDGIPNDPLFGQQWPLHNTGQSHPRPGNGSGYGTPDVDIDAPEAWLKYTWDRNIIVAVVDTGVDYTHPDIAANMWQNAQGEFGYDFINDDNDPMDDNGHGTHVSGTVAAVHDNGIGISGVCPNARIMALKFLGEDGRGNLSDAADAFYYAVENGAEIISNSWGGDFESEVLQQAIRFAAAQGVLMVAAAGNRNRWTLQYPAAYEDIISVGATDANDRKTGFSNFGHRFFGFWIDLTAPGLHVLSLKSGGGYEIRSGTSMSCPHVAGALAMLVSTFSDLSRDQLTARLLGTTDDIAPYNPEFARTLGVGRLNVRQALALTEQPRYKFSAIEFEDVVGNGNDIPEPGETVAVTFELENIWLNGGKPEVERIETRGQVVSLPVEPTTIDSSVGSVIGRFVFQIPSDIVLPARLTFDLVIASERGPLNLKELPVQVSWSLRDGWPYQYHTGIAVSEAIAADLDQDRIGEFVIGQTVALTVLAQGEPYNASWPIELPSQTGSWAIGNLDDDADLEIIGYRTDNGGGVRQDMMFAFNPDGTPVSGIWPWVLPPNTLGEEGRLTLADFDDDGISEIVATSIQPSLFVLRGDGSLYGSAWPVDLGSLRNLHVAVADINSDAQLEIVVAVGGHDMSNNHAIHVYDEKGQMMSGWPFTLGEPPWAAVVVGDLTGLGTKDIVFVDDNAQVFALNVDGELLPGWPVQLPFNVSHESVVLGDLNQDGRPEVLVAGDFTPYIFAYDYSGVMVDGWPAVVDRAERSLLPYINVIQAIGDLDGDQMPEVVVGTRMGTYIFNHDGTPLPGVAPLITGTASLHCDYPGAFSIADIDNDDNVELLIAMSGNAFVYDFNGKTSDIQWARYRSDLGNTGAYQPTDCNKNGISDRWEIVSASARDCNSNDVPDDCDLSGDSDGDGSVGLMDVAMLVAELTGPSGFIECSMLDVDADSDIDLVDYAAIQRALTDVR